MRSREQVLERYEDAGFALMMYDFALEAGSALQRQNAELKTRNPDMASEGFLQKTLKTIHAALPRKKRSGSKKLIKRLPLVAVIAALLLGLMFAASASIRSGVYDFFRINHKGFTELKMSGQSANSTLDLTDLPFKISLPEDMVLESCYHSSLMMSAAFIGQTDAAKTLSVDISCSASSSVSVDNEQQTRERSVLIHGNEAILRANDEQTWLTWGDLSIPGIIVLLASGLDDDTVIQIAESIQVKPAV